MKKRLLFLFIFSLVIGLVITGCGQMMDKNGTLPSPEGNLIINVTDEYSGEGVIADVTIIKGGELVTQKRGQMVDFDLDEGEYQLSINEYGYEEWVKDISLTGTTTLEAELIAYNLLGNGDFSEDVFMDADENGEGNFDTENNWLYLLNTESVSGTAVVESEEVLIDIDTGEGPFYAIQLIQAPLMIEQGTMYRVSFEARADSQRDIGIKIGGTGGAGWAAYNSGDGSEGSTVFEVDTGMQSYSFDFVMGHNTDELARFEFLLGGENDSKVWIDNVSLKKAGNVEVTGPTTGNWVFDQDFFFIFNVAVGGQWPGYPDESTEFPQRMEVDYIRVYDLEGDLQWGDEFNNIDTDIWTFEVGNGHANGIPGWGNAESQYYTDGDNAEIEGGKLVIEAREEERSDSYGNYEYTSSRMITRDAVMMKYGRVEIRAKLPEGQGIWPAIWMLGTDGGWPDCGEIDIMELVGHQPDTVHGTVHGPGYSGGNGIGSSYQLSDGKFSDDFHTFILEWDEDEIRWFVDDELEPFHTIWMDADGYVDYDDKPDELDITEGEVVNGTFDDPIVDDQDGSPDNWFVWYGEGGYVTDYGVEDGEFKIEIAQLGNETWAVQFNQFIKLTEGNYELSFEARAEDERGINIMVQEDGGGWAVFGEENIDITTDMQEYSIDVSLSYTETPKLSFSLGNTPNGVPTTVYIDNVSIEKVD